MKPGGGDRESERWGGWAGQVSSRQGTDAEERERGGRLRGLNDNGRCDALFRLGELLGLVVSQSSV